VKEQYNIRMRPEERRRQGTSHVSRLHDQESPDLGQAADLSPQAQMEALWDLTLEYLAWTQPNERECRLQRSVCSVERRAS